MNFKPGDAVTVQLDEKLEKVGTISYPAKFVSYHPNPDWCTVELEKQHAGGTKILNVPLHIVAPVVEKKAEKQS